MLRLYFLQQWFNLSDPGMEEAVYDSQAMRRFVGIDLGHGAVPDETMVCHFCHLLEAPDLGRCKRHLAANGLPTGCRWRAARATIISAPSSTKNRDKACDPEMHQTKRAIHRAVPSVARPGGVVRLHHARNRSNSPIASQNRTPLHPGAGHPAHLNAPAAVLPYLDVP